MTRSSLPTVISQGTAALYPLVKDAYSSFEEGKQNIKDLEDKLSDLITTIESIKSEKIKIDRSLIHSVNEEKSAEYPVMEFNISAMEAKCIKYIQKYTSLTGNALNLASEKSIITELGNLRSTIYSLDFPKLQNLSKDITKLSNRAFVVRERMKREFMTQNKSESLQEKLDDDKHYLPVFDTHVDKVLKCLLHKGSVGIYGPVGVGKSTVLRRLRNCLIDSNLQMEYVIFTEYPAELETKEKIVEKLQKEIWLQLNINNKASESIQMNKNAISAFLRGKKCILLMDNVSDDIDLIELGLGVDQQCQKVVIASRDKKVINLMTADVVEIPRLGEDDGMRLFKIIHGELSDNRREPIVVRMIECCGGIPWMISHVAKLLKGKPHESSWEGVKSSLQSDSKFLDLIGLGGMDGVYRMIYKELESVHKKCLLYGVLFPNHHKIYKDYLVECWIAEGLLGNDSWKRKVRHGRDQGQAILDSLTNKDLLQWCSDRLHVQMPLYFKRVALALDYPDTTNREIWVPSDDLELKEETWTTVTRMSLIDCKCNDMELPESPECSNMYTLLLQSLKPLEKLAEFFFRHMKNLKILDLSRTEIRSLPSSISSLENLKSMNLNDCNHLEGLPPEAASLTKIEFLNIGETSIPSLPQEIGSMSELRCLRASRCASSNGKEENSLQLVIPLDIIRLLEKLEELSINNSFINQDLAKELASLKLLSTVNFNFPKVSSVDTFVDQSNSLTDTTTSWEKRTLRSFRICIGCEKTNQHPYESALSGMQPERRLRFSTNENFSTACEKLLEQASAFELLSHDGVESLSKFNLHSLKACVVGRCKKLKHVVDGNTAVEVQCFVQRMPQNMEKLYLYDLELLDCICNGPVPSQSFIKLRNLTINGCPNLRKIFDQKLANAMQSLEYLKVEDCSETLEIVEINEGSSNKHILKRLRRIELINLPKLQWICSSNSIIWESLSIKVDNCSNLKNYV